MANPNKYFPSTFLDAIENTDTGNWLRTAGDTFWQQRLAYHSASGGAGGQVEYLGFARPGTTISASGWAIKFLGYDASGNVTGIQWAGSSLDMNKCWQDRSTYVYG